MITFLQSIIFLVFVCLLLMDFLFGQVCLHLAWEAQYLVDRSGIHQTTASQTFVFHGRSFIIFAKGSTHFLLSASTISFSVCTTVLTAFFLFILKLSCKEA